MKRSNRHLPALFLLLLVSVLGALLRQQQLATALDGQGLPVAGHPMTLALVAYCVVMVAVMGLFCLRLPARKSWKAVYGASATLLALSLAAGFLILFASLLHIVQSLLSLRTTVHQGTLVLGILSDGFGIMAGLCVLIAAGVRQQRKAPVPVLYILPFLFVLVRTVVDFRSWSSDPIILDYCFKLFALLCAMGGSYRIGGFCFDLGRRQLTAFWAMTGVFFSVLSLPSCDMVDICFFCAVAVWMFSCVWMVLGAGADPKLDATCEAGGA